LDIVLGLREFFHNPHNNRLGPPGKITALGLMWGDRRRNSMADRDRHGDRRAGIRRCFGTSPAKLPIQVPLFKALATLPGLTRRKSLAVAPQPTGGIARWQSWRNEAQKSPDARRRYRVGLVEKQTPSCSGLHKMWSRDGRSAQHRAPGRRTGVDRV
jgi:hypothetical protein